MEWQKNLDLPLSRANLCYMLAAVMQTPIAYITLLIFRCFFVDVDIGIISNAASAAYQILILFLPFVWYCQRYDATLQSVRLIPPRISLIIRAILLAFCGSLLANNLGTWWMLAIDALGLTIPPSNVDVPSTVSELIRNIVVIGFLPGICEELFFRGMVWKSWERCGTKCAFIVSSVLFALLHGSVLGLPVQLLMGFVLGYLMLLNQSIYVSMTYHAAYNIITLLLAFWSTRNGYTMTDAIYSDVNGYVAQNIGYVSLFVSTILTSGLFVGVLMWMRSGKTPEWMPVLFKRSLNRVEILTLACGLIAAGFLLVNDIARFFPS